MVQISPASMQRSLTPDTWLLQLASKSGVVFFHFIYWSALQQATTRLVH